MDYLYTSSQQSEHRTDPHPQLGYSEDYIQLSDNTITKPEPSDMLFHAQYPLVPSSGPSAAPGGPGAASSYAPYSPSPIQYDDASQQTSSSSAPAVGRRYTLTHTPAAASTPSAVTATTTGPANVASSLSGPESYSTSKPPNPASAARRSTVSSSSHMFPPWSDPAQPSVPSSSHSVPPTPTSTTHPHPSSSSGLYSTANGTVGSRWAYSSVNHESSYTPTSSFYAHQIHPSTPYQQSDTKGASRYVPAPVPEQQPESLYSPAYQSYGRSAHTGGGIPVLHHHHHSVYSQQQQQQSNSPSLSAYHPSHNHNHNHNHNHSHSHSHNPYDHSTASSRSPPASLSLPITLQPALPPLNTSIGFYGSSLVSPSPVVQTANSEAHSSQRTSPVLGYAENPSSSHHHHHNHHQHHAFGFSAPFNSGEGVTTSASVQDDEQLPDDFRLATMDDMTGAISMMSGSGLGTSTAATNGQSSPTVRSATGSIGSGNKSSPGPGGAGTSGGGRRTRVKGGVLPAAMKELEPSMKTKVDELLIEYLNWLCRTGDAKDRMGHMIHQNYTSKRTQRYEQMYGWRPLKFRIEAFVNGFIDSLSAKGYSQDVIVKIPHYLNSSKLFSRFNESGNRMKSQGQTIWRVRARIRPPLPDQPTPSPASIDQEPVWEFLPYERSIVGMPPLAVVGSLWQWNLKVHDHWTPRRKVTWSVQGMPSWMSLVGSKIRGIPKVSEDCVITVIGRFQDEGDPTPITVNGRFTVQVSRALAGWKRNPAVTTALTQALSSISPGTPTDVNGSGRRVDSDGGSDIASPVMFGSHPPGLLHMQGGGAGTSGGSPPNRLTATTSSIYAPYVPLPHTMGMSHSAAPPAPGSTYGHHHHSSSHIPIPPTVSSQPAAQPVQSQQQQQQQQQYPLPMTRAY